MGNDHTNEYKYTKIKQPIELPPDFNQRILTFRNIFLDRVRVIEHTKVAQIIFSTINTSNMLVDGRLVDYDVADIIRDRHFFSFTDPTLVNAFRTDAPSIEEIQTYICRLVDIGCIHVENNRYNVIWIDYHRSYD